MTVFKDRLESRYCFDSGVPPIIFPVLKEKFYQFSKADVYACAIYITEEALVLDLIKEDLFSIKELNSS